MKHHSLSGCIFMQNGSVFHYSIGKTQAQANFMISYQFPCSFFMGRFHARMKICPQKATEGSVHSIVLRMARETGHWSGKLVTDTRKTVNSLMPPRQNKKQRRCAEYRQEHLPCRKCHIEFCPRFLADKPLSKHDKNYGCEGIYSASEHIPDKLLFFHKHTLHLILILCTLTLKSLVLYYILL